MTRVIRIDKILSQDLALRDNADYLFTTIESFPEMQITIDFTDVKSISRSFAHQYIVNKKTSRKMITETNIPRNLAKMFEVVTSKTQRSTLQDLDSMQVLTI